MFYWSAIGLPKLRHFRARERVKNIRKFACILCLIQHNDGWNSSTAASRLLYLMAAPGYHIWAVCG
jgi:hypothetical protein